MKLSKLIEELIEVRDSLDEDPPVLLAYQQSYPLASGVRGVALDSECEEDREGRPEIVWLVQGSGDARVNGKEWNPYDVPRDVWEVAR